MERNCKDWPGRCSLCCPEQDLPTALLEFIAIEGSINGSTLSLSQIEILLQLPGPTILLGYFIEVGGKFLFPVVLPFPKTQADMDFKGQWLAERMGVILVTLFGVISFLLGYVLQSFALMMSVYGGGLALALLITVPDWPMYNLHPLEWQAPQPAPQQQREKTAAQKIKRRQKPSWRNFWKLF